MQMDHKRVNFEDDRGTITDIFVNEPKQHCTIIVTYKGAVRGNHYHKQSRQHDFIISGKLEVFSRRMGEAKIERVIVGPHDFLTWDPNVAHEFIALEDSTMMTFVDGVRGGHDYEKDTFRLSTPLHEQANVENTSNIEK
jgi:dTDP-4-dehydrorhamnose 3,5-epimerase-like enzyme